MQRISTESMGYSSLCDELNRLADQFLVINSNAGEQSVIRGMIARLWSQLFTDPVGFRVILEAMDLIDWNQSLESIRDLMLSLDDILVEISNLVENGLRVNIMEFRSRIHWKINFLEPKVADFVRQARIRLIAKPGIAGDLDLLASLDFDRLTYLDQFDSERITALNLFSDFEFKEIPPSELERALQVSIILIDNLRIQ